MYSKEQVIFICDVHLEEKFKKKSVLKSQKY